MKNRPNRKHVADPLITIIETAIIKMYAPKEINVILEK